jgi:hypothetical protein
LLALLVTGGVVAPVLAQVALFPAVVDLGCDDRSIGDQLIELGIQAVVRLLGQPSDLGVGPVVALPSSLLSRIFRVRSRVFGAGSFFVYCRSR